jgi:arginine:pyruvate transaminase
MRYAPVTDRLANLGGAKWDLHARARVLKQLGHDIIELTIGEPDIPSPQSLMDVAIKSMCEGRTGYSNGQGEPNLLNALAARYTKRSGRDISPLQVMCFPGTQTTLYGVLTALVTQGDEVLVGDPMYATYEGLIASTGAKTIHVPLRAESEFRLQAADVEARLTEKSKVIFLNTPHNPTGAILQHAEIVALCELAKKHDLWIISDEVYEEMVFKDARFISPLSYSEYADRVIVASSISKSHALPGFRSGWCVGPAEFCARLLPLAETMLFGNQPFIADMTAAAVSAPSPVATGMAQRFERRARLITDQLHNVAGLSTNSPQAGMFALVNVCNTGLSGRAFAWSLLENQGVAVMPGDSFGPSLEGWIRLSLTQPDELITQACKRIAMLATELVSKSK